MSDTTSSQNPTWWHVDVRELVVDQSYMDGRGDAVATHMILRMEERLARFSFIAARAGFKGRGNERIAAGRDDLDVPVRGL